MKISSYSIGVVGDDVKLNLVVDVDSVEAAVALIAENGEEPKKGKKSKTKAAPAPKKGKKAAEPEEEEEEDDEDDEDDGDEDEPEDEEDDEEDDEDEDEDEEEEEEEKPKKGKKGKESAAKKGPGVKVKITPELKSAEKLRAVLQVLMKQGLKTKKDLTAACVALQGKLPVLKNITDLETRVPRAVELIDPKMK